MGRRSRSRSRSNHKKSDRRRSRSGDREHRGRERDRERDRDRRKRSRSDEKKSAPLRQSKEEQTKHQATEKVGLLWEKLKEEKQEEEAAMLKVQEKYGFTKKAEHKGPEKLVGVSSYNPVMIEVIVNDRLGKKERIKCLPSDTIGILKRLIQAKTGTRADKIKLQRQHQVFKDHITLDDYEIHEGSSIEMYYN